MNEEERQRLWEWTLHEDQLFSDRQNLFLVAQSMLVAAYAGALSVSATSAAAPIGVIGVLLTLTWLFVSWRECTLVDYIQAHAQRELAEYRAVSDHRPKVEIGGFRIRSRSVIAFVLPTLLLALWAALLIRLA